MSNTTAAPAITPDEPELIITIAGRAKTGKSTVALAIALLLEKMGVEVHAINDEVTPEQQEFLSKNLAANLKALGERMPKVIINMAQLERDAPKLILPPGAR